MSATLNASPNLQAKIPGRFQEGQDLKSVSRDHQQLSQLGSSNAQSPSETQSTKYLNPVEEASVSSEAREASTATNPDVQSMNGHASIQALLANFSLCGNLPNKIEPVSKSQETRSAEESVKAFDGKAAGMVKAPGEYANKLVEVGSDSSSAKLNKNPSPSLAVAAEIESSEQSPTKTAVAASSAQNLTSTFQPSKELLETQAPVPSNPAFAPGQMIQAHLT